MIRRYKQKPIIVEAIQYQEANLGEIKDFTEGEVEYNRHNGYCYISTLEGKMKFSKGDYVIKGIEGEFYPCKKKIFEESYELYDEKGGEI